MIASIATAAGVGPETLTDAVLRYQRSGEGYRELIERIAVLIYRFPMTRAGSEEDDCGEFYCYFIPKVFGLIRRFAYRGKPFEAYLVSSMKWQYKTFVMKKSNRNVACRTLGRASFWPEGSTASHPTFVSEAPSVTPRARSLLQIDRSGVIANPTIARRLLVLALKASEEIDRETIGEVARIAGVEADWVCERIESLHALLEERRERQTLLRRRRDQAYFRMRYFQERLAVETEGPAKKRLEYLLGVEREHLTHARRDLSRVPVSPTHKDIASVLEIPKGSVDSSLFYARGAWAGAVAQAPGRN